jgi:hypothetical protein
MTHYSHTAPHDLLDRASSVFAALNLDCIHEALDGNIYELAGHGRPHHTNHHRTSLTKRYAFRRAISSEIS